MNKLPGLAAEVRTVRAASDGQTLTLQAGSTLSARILQFRQPGVVYQVRVYESELRQEIKAALEAEVEQ